ncbi:DUF3598 family protein [Pseudanabaena yagii]|uniref:DUF3598 family protein n=1 Tax=Pseudanabaena yagii GIHE-NHR1 TaxID=2722753 RepID=A0ABX1LVX8_9CYAN|nr:DUF3598 family protein [Pseudanabaena yagii]NMF60304.1 DUF3598 family protein [Pseudanabaena yagii GIHE-NHR1]
MRSQWECLLQNLGCWQGSFARLSPQGEILEDIPSETSLELKEDQQTMHQVVRRFYDGQPQDLVLEYRTLNKSIILFENGAFSQGSIQFSPVAEFGAELGLIYGDRRLRIIPLYDKTSKLQQFTLIREHLPHSNTPERPPLTLDALLGKWEGEAITLSPDWLTPEVTPTVTEWRRDGDRAIMSLQMPTIAGTQTITSIAHIDPHNPQILRFEQNPISIQTLFLPDGSSLTCPETIIPRQPFRLSISWLLETNLHQRMIRAYNPQGGWENLTLVTERKVG